MTVDWERTKQKMEIRLLYGNELQQAVWLAQAVFEQCVHPQLGSSEETEAFYREVQFEALWQGMCAGQLVLWGAYDRGQFCGVSGMRQDGSITMLYVLPGYARRHIGAQLTDHMCAYAANVLRRERVTVRVVPLVAAPFFYHIGFTLVQESIASGSGELLLERRIWSIPRFDSYPVQQARVQYVQIPPGTPYPAQQTPPCPIPPVMPAQKPGWEGASYPVRKVSSRFIVVLTALVLAVSFTVICAVTTHHMVTDGMEADTETEEWQPPEDSMEL